MRCNISTRLIFPFLFLYLFLFFRNEKGKSLQSTMLLCFFRGEIKLGQNLVQNLGIIMVIFGLYAGIVCPSTV